MSNVKSAQIVMLIVAMLAQTTTAVPEQRLLLPQHWLLADWDMVCSFGMPLGALVALLGVGINKGLPTRSSTLEWAAGTLRHSTRSEYVPPKLATPRICLLASVLQSLALPRRSMLE